MNIMHVRDSGFFGSAESLIAGQIRILSKKGFHFTVASFENSNTTNAFLQRLSEMGFSTIALRGMLRASIRLMTAIRRNNIQLLASHDYKSNFCAIIVGTLLRVPTMAIFHGRTGHDAKILFYERLDDGLLKAFDRIICVSEHTKRTLTLKGIAPSKLSVIYNAVASNRSRRSHSTVSIRKELNMPNSAKIVVNIGRVSPEKGQRYFIKAAFNLLDRIPDCYFLIVGDGPDLKTLKKSTAATGYSKRIIFTGFRNDVLAILEQSDLLVLCSRTEGMPLVVLEAFALRVPVLCSPVGGIPEIVSDGVTGFLCPPHDSLLLGSRIMQALNSPINSAITEAAYQLVTKELSFESYAGKFSEVYLETVLRKRHQI